jgi:hypothetical protein
MYVIWNFNTDEIYKICRFLHMYKNLKDYVPSLSPLVEDELIEWLQRWFLLKCVIERHFCFDKAFDYEFDIYNPISRCVRTITVHNFIRPVNSLDKKINQCCLTGESSSLMNIIDHLVWRMWLIVSKSKYPMTNSSSWWFIYLWREHI